MTKANRTILVFLFLLIFALVYYFHISTDLIRFFGPKYQWRPEFGDLNGPDIPATSPRLKWKLKEKYLLEPNLADKYNLSDPATADPSMGQSQVIRKIFKDKNPGFFIECGALDGETRSNTLYLEKFKSWTGLLIEADPSNFKLLLEKGRKAWISNSCLSIKDYPTMVSFEQKANQGRISDESPGYLSANHIAVQCFPFSTYMSVLNVSRVDYFSLDVEGAELDILKTIDFSIYDIKTLSVEFIHDKEGKVAIKDFMESKGYYVLEEITHPNWLANDFIFVQKGFYSEA